MPSGPRNTTNRKGSLNLLTTDNGEIPEFLINGVPVGDGADFKIVEISGNYPMESADDLIIIDGTGTITLVDPREAKTTITIRNISGITGLISIFGTVEQASLTQGLSVTLVPRQTGWFIV